MEFEKNKFSFNTKKDIEKSLLDTIYPLSKLYFINGRLDLGSSGSIYKKDTRNIEAFLRILWGLGPLWSGSSYDDYLDIYINGLINGTNPKSYNYFGDITDFDQLAVEMAAIVVTLMLNREKIWERLNEKEKFNLTNWLRQINEKKIAKNNWHFFRILVNICLKQLGVDYSEDRLSEDLNIINSFYVGNGWYYDGLENQRDYYISWAFHYYGLVYYKFMKDSEPLMSNIFKERAIEFSKSYLYMFDKNGNGVPFGRSLTYRFAQSAFWAALVFADIEAIPWAQITYMYIKNMSSWYDKNIFTIDGVLSIGYSYQNLLMSEGYNAPGSPYWAFKSYLILAVKDDHKFWDVEMEKPDDIKEQYLNVEGRCMYIHTNNSNHVQMFPFGQDIKYQPHGAAKYSKFVYSTLFGFSVPKSTYYYYESALDNVLSVSEDGVYFRPKVKDEKFYVNKEYISYKWNPYTDVDIYSTIVPCGDYHVRIHEINTNRKLVIREGGFSIPYYNKDKIQNDKFAKYISEIGTSEIISIEGFESSEVVILEPNTNLLYERTVLPTLISNLEKGKHILISIVGGIPKDNIPVIPIVKYLGNKVSIMKDKKEILIELIN